LDFGWLEGNRWSEGTELSRHPAGDIATRFSNRRYNMTRALCNVILAVLALLWLPATAAIAAESVEGTIESLSDSKISIKDKDGKIHSFDVDSAAKITLDGKTAKLDTLGVGSTATVSTETKNNKSVAVTIDARSKMTSSATVPSEGESTVPRPTADSRVRGNRRMFAGPVSGHAASRLALFWPAAGGAVAALAGRSDGKTHLGSRLGPTWGGWHAKCYFRPTVGSAA
jgi:hypothetical protein